MKLAASNIAWPATERDAAYKLLHEKGITGLEIAPALFLNESNDPFCPTDDEVARAMDAAENAGLCLVSMQSLLFGASNVALFEGEARLEAFVQSMRKAILLAGRLSIPNLVFGSPKQRNIPDGLSYAEAEHLALDVFRKLGDMAGSVGTKLGMEPNPTAYGTNFLNRVEDAFAFVEKVNHPHITLILDIGALHLNNDFDEVEIMVQKAAKKISHVHFSEPYLVPAPSSADEAKRVMNIMADINYEGWLSIEMKMADNNSLTNLEKSLDTLNDAIALSRSELS